MTQRFVNKNVIVIGAGSGIGLTTASGFVQEGAMVMVADLSARRAQAAVETIRAQGDNAVWRKMDAAEPDDVESTIQALSPVPAWLSMVVSAPTRGYRI